MSRRRLPIGKRLLALLAAGLLAASLAIYGLASLWPFPSTTGGNPPPPLSAVDVHLQPTCGCCHEYVQYLESAGLHVVVHEVVDVVAIKEQYSIPIALWSCHTASLGGYFVEGHVPMQAIEQLLDHRSDVDGVSLPGMPAGSPGMGGVKLSPFVIFSITNGQTQVFMEI